jgi:hypothetical protein
MAAPIIVNIPHQLGAEGAQDRIARGLDKARADFAAVLQSVDVVWRANHADVEVVAAKQNVRCALDVFADNVRLEVNLPWYLAPLQQKIADLLNQRGKEILALPKL